MSFEESYLVKKTSNTHSKEKVLWVDFMKPVHAKDFLFLTLFCYRDSTIYAVPFLIHVTQGVATLEASQQLQVYSFFPQYVYFKLLRISKRKGRTAEQVWGS